MFLHGLNPEQTVGIADFLATYLRDVIKKGQEDKLTALQTVEREIHDIDAEPKEIRRNRHPAAQAILDLIRSFYVKIYQRRLDVRNYEELLKVSSEVSRFLLDQIESIKIGEPASV